MLYDPIDAFFQGITSAILRVPLAFIPLLVALGCFSLPNSEMGAWGIIAFPFVMLGVIIAWAAHGLVFFIGFAAFFAYLLLAWHFIQTDFPKELFVALFVVASVFFIPLIWDASSRPWVSFAFGGGILSVYVFLSYGLPIILQRFDKEKNA